MDNTNHRATRPKASSQRNQCVAGIPLRSFAQPIREALLGYERFSGGCIRFTDLAQAAQLKLTPDKPYSARSETEVIHSGHIGQLCIIAFAPYEGTGDENTYSLADLDTGDYPRAPRVVPRSKASVFSEAHFAIASFRAGEPMVFANHLDVLGLRGGNVVAKIGNLGQPSDVYQRIMAGEQTARPTVTMTTGYLGDNDGRTGERFFDPHAIYDPEDDVQVAAFFSVPRDREIMHRFMLSSLRAIEPASI